MQGNSMLDETLNKSPLERLLNNPHNTNALMVQLIPKFWKDAWLYPVNAFGIIWDRPLATCFLEYSEQVWVDENVHFLIDAVRDGLPGSAALWNSNRASFYYKKYFKLDASNNPQGTKSVNLKSELLHEANDLFTPPKTGLVAYARRQLFTPASQIVARKERQLAVLRAAMVELCSLLETNQQPSKFYKSEQFKIYHQARLDKRPPPSPVRSHGRIAPPRGRRVVRWR